LPGNWGDNLFGWWADFLYPSLALLKVAPFIAARGNHEICSRSGYGYFLFLHHDVYNSSLRAGDLCQEYGLPFSVPFANEQFLVMDDSTVSPKEKGIDHFAFVEGACPPPTISGAPVIPLVQDRNDDSSQTTAEIEEQLEIYTKAFELMESTSQAYETNFYVAHRPVFAVACNNTDMVTLDWTMQQSLGKNTLDRISAMIGGHMHWLEALKFIDQELPAQIVVGHGGTELINDYVDQDTLPFLLVKAGKDLMYQGRVESGLTDASKFGFGIMERFDDGSYATKFMSLDMSSMKLVELDYHMTIPKGPRVAGSPTGSPKTSSAIIKICGSGVFGIVMAVVLLGDLF
jgi:hypothetical protein